MCSGPTASSGARSWRRSRVPGGWWLAFAATLLVHLYFQAAWYCWWLGLWSLGNRGLEVVSLLLLPVLARAMAEARPRGRTALGACTLLCSFWSLLLMVQGHTNFTTWTELLSAQATSAKELAPVLLALAFDHLALRVTESVTGGAAGAPHAVFRFGMIALAPLAALLLFLWTGGLFLRLALRTEPVIDGFEEKKRSLSDFLDRSEAP